MEKNKKQSQEEDNKEEQSSDYFLGSKMLAILTEETGEKLDIYKSVLDLAIELARKIGEEEIPTKRPLAVVAACIYFASLTGDYRSVADVSKICGSGPDIIKKVLQMPFFERMGRLMDCEYTKNGWRSSSFFKPLIAKRFRIKINNYARKWLDVLLKNKSEN